METRIINFLTEHPQSDALLQKLGESASYKDVFDYVWSTTRTQLVINLFSENERKTEPAKTLIADLESFLKKAAIDDLKAYKKHKYELYKDFLITKKGIEDIIDYCVMYQLSQLETSKVLDSVVHLSQKERTNRPSQAAFDFAVLWVQAWQARTFTKNIKSIGARLGIKVDLEPNTGFREFKTKFNEIIEHIKLNRYENQENSK